MMICLYFRIVYGDFLMTMKIIVEDQRDIWNNEISREEIFKSSKDFKNSIHDHKDF